MKNIPFNTILLEILVALGFLNLSISFIFLDLILPLIAYGILIFNLYRLKSFDPLFKSALIVTLIKAVLFIASTSLMAGRLYLEYDEVFLCFTIFNLFLNLFLFLMIYEGFKKLCHKNTNTQALAYAIWYIFLLILALINYHGLIIPLLMAVLLIVILYKTNRLFKTDLLISYDSFKAPVILICVLGVSLLLGVFINYYFFASLKQDYEPFKSQEITISGIDKKITNDLLKEDLDYLQEADDIKVLINGEDSIGAKSLVAQLADEKYIVHYLTFLDTYPKRNIYLKVDPLATAYDIHMSVLYDKDTKTYYEDIREYEKGENESLDFEFSYPHNADNKRAYVAYKVSKDDELLHNEMEYLSFIHQISPFNYPFISAKDARSGFLNTHVFRLTTIFVNHSTID